METQLHLSKKVLRLNQVMGVVGLGRSAIYQRVAEGTFPRPINLGPRAVGWLSAEVEAWLEGRVAVRDSIAR